jgi:hypothetical protein
MRILAKKVGKWNRVRLTQTCNGNYKVWASQKSWFADDLEAAEKKFKKVARGIDG